MSEPTGNYYAPGQGPLPGQPGYGEPIPSPWAPNGHHEATAQYPYGAPAQYGQQSLYGQQSQYGQQWLNYGPPGPRPSGATVITAAVVQIVQASLLALGGLAILLLADVVDNAGDEIDRRSGSDVSGTTDVLSRWVAVFGVVLLASAVFMIVLAALAIRGKRWAALTSVVLQGLIVVGGLIGLTRSGSADSPGASVVSVLASLAVVVLFLLPASTTYFAARSATR